MFLISLKAQTLNRLNGANMINVQHLSDLLSDSFNLSPVCTAHI